VCVRGMCVKLSNIPSDCTAVGRPGGLFHVTLTGQLATHHSIHTRWVSVLSVVIL